MNKFAGLLMLLAVPAHAEWDPGSIGFRAFDILDVYDSPIGEMIVADSGYSGSTNLSAGSEHWHWDSSPWIDHFRVTPTGAADHSIDTPFQRYTHTAFPQNDGSMPTVGSSPVAWRLTRLEAGGPVTLDVVVTRNSSTGAMVWAADGSEINGDRLLDLAEGEAIQFDRITSNPGSMQANAAVRLLSLSQL